MRHNLSNSIAIERRMNTGHDQRQNSDWGTSNIKNNKYSHAVCRSAEFLSCVKTAVRIAQSRLSTSSNISNGHKSQVNNDQIKNLSPSDLELYSPNKQKRHSPLNDILEDGLEILRAMESELDHLNELVRRRGHSNDPTIEISNSVASIERDAAELTSIVLSMIQRGSVGYNQSQQRQRHIKAIQEWFQSMIQQYSSQLKDILSVRASVLSDQARRRGMFQPNNNNTSNLSTAASLSSANAYGNVGTVVTSEAQNALFAPLPPRITKPNIVKQQNIHTNVEGSSHHLPKKSDTNQMQLSYGSVNSSSMYSGGGYGGNYYTHSNGTGHDNTMNESGIRRRKQQSTTNMNGGEIGLEINSSSDSNQQQFALYQQQQQQQDRQTTARLKEARQAEQSLAALGTIFGKMSTLIVQQSETLNKIEDDVEAANVDVHAGHDEITTLYSIKKGNRMLIIKVYSLLIFLIVFMRFYARK